MNGQLQYNRGLTEPRLPRSALAVRVQIMNKNCIFYMKIEYLMELPHSQH